MFIPDPSDGERSLDKSLWTDGLLASVLLALAPRAPTLFTRARPVAAPSTAFVAQITSAVDVGSDQVALNDMVISTPKDQPVTPVA